MSEQWLASMTVERLAAELCPDTPTCEGHTIRARDYFRAALSGVSGSDLKANVTCGACLFGGKRHTNDAGCEARSLSPEDIGVSGSDRPYVPTPEDLDTLLANISAADYASTAVAIVEDWTREHWGVESAFTTSMARAALTGEGEPQ